MNQYGPDYTDEELDKMAKQIDLAGRVTVLSLIEQLRAERVTSAALRGVVYDLKQEIVDLEDDFNSLERELAGHDDQTRTIYELETELASVSEELRERERNDLKYW